MFLAAVVLLAVVAAWALGAELTRLATLHFRGTGFVFGALATQLVIFTGLSSYVPSRLDTGLHVLTYVLLLAFLVINGRHPGLWISGLGLAANTTAIFANGGRMPISLGAWTATGRPAAAITTHGFYNNNVLVGPHASFGWLGDVFALPASVPLATAFSVGDVLILFGAIAFICRACGPSASFSARQLLQPLGSSDFRRLLGGRAASKLGDLLTMTAVVTWLFTRSHSTALVSAFLIVRILSATVGGTLAAPLLNQVHCFRTLSIIESIRGLLTLGTLPFALHGQVLPVIVLVCLSALVGAATNPSAASLIPDLLPPELVNIGNSLHGVARNFVMVLGAATGSFSVIRFGIGGALLIDFATFCVAAGLYTHFSTRQQTEPVGVREPVSRRELFRGLFGYRLIFGLTASFALVTAAMGLLNASLPAFFSGRIGESGVYGYAMAAIGAGLMCGELLTGFVRTERVGRRSVLLAFALSGASVFVLGGTRSASTAYLMLFLLGMSDGSTEVVRDTLFQRHLPRRVRAGTFAIASSFQNVGMVLGLALAPVVLSKGSPKLALEVVAIGCLAGAVIAAPTLLRRVASGRSPAAATATFSPAVFVEPVSDGRGSP